MWTSELTVVTSKQHDGGEPVDGETDVNIEQARCQPGIEGEAGLVAACHVEEDQEREQPRHDDRRNGDEVGVVLDPMAEKPEDQERSQRKERNEFVGHNKEELLAYSVWPIAKSGQWRRGGLYLGVDPIQSARAFSPAISHTLYAISSAIRFTISTTEVRRC